VDGFPVHASIVEGEIIARGDATDNDQRVDGNSVHPAFF
jgi:hypothetical protein